MLALDLGISVLDWDRCSGCSVQLDSPPLVFYRSPGEHCASDGNSRTGFDHIEISNVYLLCMYC
jgi:hypothetical protein